MPRPFFITSARLASMLSMNGIELTPCVNIYNETMRAWKTPLNEKSAAIIADFYRERKRPVPRIVAEILDQN